MIPDTNQPVFRVRLDSDLLGPQLLRYEPLGLDGVGVTLNRDRKTHGVTTEHSGNLGFVKDGKAYVLRAYQAAGIEADVQAQIEQLVPNEFAWAPYYAGRLNYTTAEFTATQAKLNLEQASFLQKFLSRDSVQVDLLAGTSVGGLAGPTPTPVQVNLHSRALQQRYAASQKSPVEVTAPMFGGDGDASHEQLLYFGFDTPELNELGVGAVGGGWVTGEAASAVPIYTAKGPESLVLDVALYMHVEAHTGTGVPFMRQFTKVGSSVFLRVTGKNAAQVRLQPDIAAGNLDGDYEGEISVAPRQFSLELEEGDKVYLFSPWFVHDLDGGQFDPYQATISATFLPGSSLRLSAVTRTAATPTTGLLLYEGLERLAQALTDEVDVFRSDFFGRPDTAVPYEADGPGALTLLTGGFQVRGFPLLSAAPPAALDLRKTLTASWADTFSSLQAIYNLGCGVEWVTGRNGKPRQVVRVEHFSHFYPAAVVLDLTGAGPLAITTRVLADDHYQVAEMGYQQWQAQTAGGLDEFNSTRQWTTPLTQVSSTYSQLSKLVASGTLLEATRRDRYDATATTDTSQDATNFLVCLTRTGGNPAFETERNQLAMRVEGVLSPETVYNLRLSPARLLRRHGPVLRAGLQPTQTATVRYAAGTGNTRLVSQLVDETAPVAESADVPVRQLPAPLWLPLSYQAQGAPVSRQQLQGLLLRPTGRVRVLNDQGQVVEGWVLDFAHHATAETADFTLLACA